MPPVASRSSTRTTRWPGWMASRWISSESVAVLQVVADAGGWRGELLGLAHGDEAGVEAVGQRGAEDEAARLDAEDQVDLLADVVLRQRVDELREAGLVLQQRGDVVEEDAGLGEVGHGADELLQRLAVDWFRWGHYHAPSIWNDCNSSPSLSATGWLSIVVDAASAGAAGQRQDEVLQLVGRTGGEHLDVPVVGVAHPSAQANARPPRAARTSESPRPAPGL